MFSASTCSISPGSPRSTISIAGAAPAIAARAVCRSAPAARSVPIRTATSGSSLALLQSSIERPSVLVMPLASEALVRNPVSGAVIDAACIACAVPSPAFQPTRRSPAASRDSRKLPCAAMPATIRGSSVLACIVIATPSMRGLPRSWPADCRATGRVARQINEHGDGNRDPRNDRNRHPGAAGPAAVVTLALEDPDRPRHRLDPRRARGDDRRLDRRRDLGQGLGDRHLVGRMSPGWRRRCTSPAPVSARCCSAS